MGPGFLESIYRRALCHELSLRGIPFEYEKELLVPYKEIRIPGQRYDILVEQARRKAGPKRGGGRRREELDEACAILEPPSDDVLAVHEALADLEQRDPLKAQIVLLRYFTGLTMEETAEILGMAERTLDRHWRYIRAWLMKRLS